MNVELRKPSTSSPLRLNFAGCESLTSVTLPSTLTSIGKNAFSCVINLATVNAMKQVPFNLDESVFAYLNDNYNKDIIYLAATFNVPTGRKALYSNVAGWKKFMNIQESAFAGVDGIASDTATPAKYYSVNGKQHSMALRGLNIIRMSDGTMKKVVKK